MRNPVLHCYARCFVCLSRGHISRTCTVEYQCNRCSGRHHIAICEKDKLCNRTAITHSSVTEQCFLLQTGRSLAYNVEDERCNSFVRILFDGGSQRSYVTSSLKEKLKLAVLRTKKLMISTFGATGSEMKKIEVVQLKINCLGDGGYVYLEVLVIPQFCAPLPNQRPKTVKSLYKHLDRLILSDYADLGDGCGRISRSGLLFFMSGTCIKGHKPNCPVALESRIGWVLTGPYR